MWENFAIAERMKQINYRHPFAQSYFWRTKQQTEIDYIEEQDGSLQAFEFKWKSINLHAVRYPFPRHIPMLHLV